MHVCMIQIQTCPYSGHIQHCAECISSLFSMHAWYDAKWFVTSCQLQPRSLGMEDSTAFRPNSGGHRFNNTCSNTQQLDDLFRRSSRWPACGYCWKRPNWYVCKRCTCESWGVSEGSGLAHTRWRPIFGPHRVLPFYDHTWPRSWCLVCCWTWRWQNIQSQQVRMSRHPWLVLRNIDCCCCQL